MLEFSFILMSESKVTSKLEQRARVTYNTTDAKNNKTEGFCLVYLLLVVLFKEHHRGL
jgi:hypothetical protein